MTRRYQWTEEEQDAWNDVYFYAAWIFGVVAALLCALSGAPWAAALSIGWPFWKLWRAWKVVR